MVERNGRYLTLNDVLGHFDTSYVRVETPEIAIKFSSNWNISYEPSHFHRLMLLSKLF